MARTLRIVGLGGSLAEVSRSRAALRVALDGAAGAGADTTLLDLRELDLPMYNPDHGQPTAAAARLIEACYAADGMLWSSPMYQGTISGAFKNALDWLHALGSSRAAVPARRGDRADQRSGRNARPAGHQYDGVRHPGAAGVGRPVRRSGPGWRRESSTRRAGPGRCDRAAAQVTRHRGRARRRTVRGRPIAASRERVRRGSRARCRFGIGRLPVELCEQFVRAGAKRSTPAA